MTEHPDLPPDGRVDLRVLDAVHDERRAEMVRQAVHGRLVRSGYGSDVYVLTRLQRVMAAAAAVLLVIAGTFVISDGGRPDVEVSSQALEQWLQSSHVPTNGELLTTYKGYRP